MEGRGVHSQPSHFFDLRLGEKNPVKESAPISNLTTLEALVLLTGSMTIKEPNPYAQPNLDRVRLEAASPLRHRGDRSFHLGPDPLIRIRFTTVYYNESRTNTFSI